MLSFSICKTGTGPLAVVAKLARDVNASPPGIESVDAIRYLFLNYCVMSSQKSLRMRCPNIRGSVWQCFSS